MDYIDKINKNSIDYQIKDSGAARSVDGDTSHVQEANEIYTTTSQSQTDAFSYRTSAGAMSINSGAATISTVYGNTVQTGHTDEVLTATGNFQTEGTTVELDKATFRVLGLENGTYNFYYDGAWKLGDVTVTLADYGLIVTGTVVEGDSISVEYVALVIGTLETATPTAFKATGYNQYNATAGYAHVVGGNQYRVAGTYTLVEFATTPTGEKTTVTVVDNKFTPEEDGYIFVTGSGNILVALAWSGTMDSEPWSAYSDNGFNVPTTDADGNNLPTATYGFPSVHGVRDEIDFAGKLYEQRIGHYAYSAENLATVEALGVDYIYDLSDIFYVLPDPIAHALASDVSGAYQVNDYGTEEWTGTNVPITTVITYGNSLVDKLRNLADIQSIGTGLTLSASGELSAAGGSGPTVVQTTGTSTTDVMSQKAVTDTIFYGNYGIKIGDSTAIGNASTNVVVIGRLARDTSVGTYKSGIVIGSNSETKNGGITIGPGSKALCAGSVTIGSAVGNKHEGANPSVLIGDNCTLGPGNCRNVVIGSSGIANYLEGIKGSISLGYYANVTRSGEMNIGTDSSHKDYSYNNTGYRLIGGVHNGIDAHDAATVGQLNALIDAINSAANTSIAHIGNA